MATPQHSSSAHASGEPVEPARQRGADGRFLAGNSVARKHGLTPPSRYVAIQETSAYVERFVSSAVARDGAPHCPTRRRSLFFYRAVMDRRFRQVIDAVALRGLIDRGRVRVTWLQVIDRLVDQACRIDLVLGWPTPVVTMTPEDWTIEEIGRRVDGVTRLAEKLKQRYIEEHGQDPRSWPSRSSQPRGMAALLDDDLFLEALIAEEAGTHPDVRQASLLEHRARLHHLILQIDRELDAWEIVDRRGKLRATWLQQLVKTIARAVRCDQILGVPPPAKERALEELTPTELDKLVASERRWFEKLKQNWTGEQGWKQ